MTELQEILKIIQFQRDCSYSEIGLKIKYRRESIERAYKAGEHPKILARLKEKYHKDISQFETKYKRGTNSDMQDQDLMHGLQPLLRGQRAILEILVNMGQKTRGEGVLEEDRQILEELRALTKKGN